MAGAINIGSIEADLKINSGNVERGLAGGRAAMDAFARELKRLDDELNAGNILLMDYTARVNAVTAAQNKMSAAMQNAYAVASTANGGLLGVTQSTGRMGSGFAMAGMQFGYMVDDIQYGLNGIINNIAPLATNFSMALGASTTMAMGIASGAQIAGVAIYQLYVHWDDFLGLLEIPTTRNEADEMENLADKTRKSADEQARLNKYKREQKEIDDLLEKKPEAEEKADKDVEKVIQNAGSKKVLDGIFRSLVAERKGAKMTDDERENLDALEKDFGPDHPLVAFHKKKVEDRLEQENIERARAIMSDPAKRDTLLGLAERNPGAFPKKFAGNVREATAPGAKQNKEVDDEDKMIDEYSDRAKDDLDREHANDRVKQEAYDEDDRQFQAGIERRKQETDNRDKRRKEVVKNAKKDSPGIDKYAQTLAAGSMVGDISPEEAMTQIRSVLKANDQEYKTKMEAAKKTETKDDDKDVEERANNRADYAGKKIMDEAGREVMKRSANESLKSEKVTHSEQFDASALASKVQAGVNNGVEAEQKKHTSYLDQAVKYLAKIARADGGNNPWAAFEEGN